MANAHVKTATDSNFDSEVLKSPAALVDFWAEWCGPCRALAPIVDEIAAENTGKLAVYKLNVDDHPDIAAKYGVRGIPTVILFKNGQVFQQSVGLVAKTNLQGLVDKVVA